MKKRPIVLFVATLLLFGAFYAASYFKNGQAPSVGVWVGTLALTFAGVFFARIAHAIKQQAVRLMHLLHRPRVAH